MTCYGYCRFHSGCYTLIQILWRMSELHIKNIGLYAMYQHLSNIDNRTKNYNKQLDSAYLCPRAHQYSKVCQVITRTDCYCCIGGCYIAARRVPTLSVKFTKDNDVDEIIQNRFAQYKYVKIIVKHKIHVVELKVCV